MRDLKNGQKGRSHHYETENVKRGGSGEGADRTLVRILQIWPIQWRRFLRDLKNGQKGRSHHYETENVKRGGSGEGADRTLVVRTGSANTMEKIFARFEERAKGKESSL